MLRGRHLAVIFFSFGLGACTSIQFSNYDDAIRVTSKKPGAEIYSDGKLIGVTPALVRVRRGYSPKLELRYPGQPGQKFKVKTRYRWLDSFLPNAIIYQVAYITFPLDFLTGTAWDLQNLEDVEVPGQAPTSVEPPNSVAVAPPSAGSKIVSDQIGGLFYEAAKKRPRWKVTEFKDTLGVFEDYQYNYENQLKGDPRTELFADLAVGHVLEAKVAPGARTAHYDIRRVTDETIVDSGDIDLPPLKIDHWDKMRWFFVGLIPNSASVDLSKHGLAVGMQDGSKYETGAQPIAGWMGEASKVLGSIGLGNLIPPRGRRVFEGHIRLTSMFTLQMNEYELPIPGHQFEDTKFIRRRFAGGAGPQFYLETVLGTFYADLFGLLGYSEIKWEGPSSSGKLGRGMGYLSAGFGYYRYLSNRLAVKLFFRAIGEDLRNWDWAMERSQNSAFETKDVSSTEAGLALVLYFPEIARSYR